MSRISTLMLSSSSGGSSSRLSPSRPSVLVLGGCDVDLRIDLMRALASEFDLVAAGSERRLAEPFRRAGFPFLHYPLSRGSNPAMDLWSVLYLHRLLRRIRPDIVHAFATKPAVWGRIAARAAGVPVVIGTVPGLGSLYVSKDLRTRVLRRVYEPLQRAACRASDLTIFYNSADADQFYSRALASPTKSTILPGSGVPTEVFDPRRFTSEARARLRSSLRVPQEAVLVTMVARVIRTKGVVEYATAAQTICRDRDDVRFLLVGPDDRESIDRLHQNEMAHLERSVIWTGPRTDVASILACTDIFVLPSYREGIARVLLEAASMALPIVTTRVPGCEDVVRENQNGFLVAPADAVGLTEALRRLVADPELRASFGVASRELAVARFDLAVVAAEIGRLYRLLLKEATGIESPEGNPFEQAGVARRIGRWARSTLQARYR